MSRRSRIRFGGNNRYFPVWTPEGDQVAFSDGPTGTNTLYLVAADGSGKVVGGERPGEGLDVHDVPYTTSLTTPVPRNANFPLTSPSASPYCSRTTSQ